MSRWVYLTVRDVEDGMYALQEEGWVNLISRDSRSGIRCTMWCREYEGTIGPMDALEDIPRFLHRDVFVLSVSELPPGRYPILEPLEF